MKYFSLFISLLISNLSFTQKLIDSRQSSFYTYIYRITDKEAEQIYKKDLWEVDERFFHTQVDSFPTDSVFKKNLPIGHYLKVHSEKNRLKIDITSVQDFDVMILRNNTDLAIQIFNLNGEIIQDADVSVRLKTIRFDNKSRSYIDRKSNQKGLLKVTYDGFTAFYDLKRQYNNSFIKRSTRKIVYGTPIKYVWAPVRYIIYLPIDGVRSISQNYPQGTISRTIWFFKKSFYKIACLFDDYYCDYYGTNSDRSSYKGYMVFNKPKYMPRDTVKIKAYLVCKNGKPVTNDVNVVLQGPRKNITLNTISPYIQGGYTYDFYLHDSLNLLLDQSYRVSLENNKEKEYISETFKYEDYELRSIQLKLAVDTTEHLHGRNAIVRVRGTDENDLNILDGRLEIQVRPAEINKYFGNYVFIPDTLAFWKQDLEKEKETNISILDSIFPKANLSYDVVVTLLTSNNESITKTERLDYYFYKSEIRYDLSEDSIEFFYQKNGVRSPIKARILGIDNFGNRTLIAEGQLPLKTGINPYYSDYCSDGDSVKTTVSLASEPSLLQCFSERSKDSIRIMVNNPRKLPFSYFIYKKNNEKTRGHSDSLNLNISTSSNENYFLAIQYLWGGKLVDENYQIPYNDKKLKITVTEPKIVYPSQSSTIEILVTDPEGNPVPDVDLTAYSITKQFEYTPPSLPYLGKQRKNKTVINSFSINERLFNDFQGLGLDYNHWKLLAGLDTIEYYRFLYPGNEIYKFQYPSNITQFAPFVVSVGQLIPIHAIYVDRKPLYFSWSTNIQPFSFAVDSGYHQVKLRTTNRILEIDSVYFSFHSKTIISLRDSIINKIVYVNKVESRLSDYEKDILYKYILPYRYQFGEYYGYIEQYEQVYFLKPGTSIPGNYLAGPVDPIRTKFQLVDSFSLKFTHEPFFEYEFAPGLLKMRSVDPKTRYPDYLHNYNIRESFTDKVLNVEDINESWKDYINQKRYLTARYNYPKTTSKGMGTIKIELLADSNKTSLKPLNILLFRYDESKFLRIYPGSNITYNDLAEGFYRILFFLPGAEYAVIDSLYVAPDGLNYHRIELPEKHIKDSFSTSVSKIIEENIFKPVSVSKTQETEIKEIYNRYQQEFLFTGVGDIIEGYIYDEDGNPIPGVTVLVKGTTFGTISNIDGYYSLNVPRGNNILSFSFIGYQQKDIDISDKKILNVNLAPDVMNLQEVVVIGYGVQRKSSLTGSVAVVNTTGIQDMESTLTASLAGKVAGVVITSSNVPGSAVSIQIRGSGTTNFHGEPLYVVDGIIFTGNINELNPNLIKGIQILKDSQATAIYGARGANGVVLINTGGIFLATKSPGLLGAEFDETFLEAASQSSSIRNDFSDYAFWQPKLVTDKEGKASFRVKFPDDVTSWKTFYLAMTGEKQSGQTEGVIKSYKPLMGQLSVPRFLVESDSTLALGKVLNYTPDTIPLKTKFVIDSTLISEKKQTCIRSIIDTFQIVASQKDSISVKYYLEKDDGYFDGEQKHIPIFPAGLEETAGQFFVLDKDTTFNISFSPISGDVRFYAKADVLDVLEEEISKLIAYKYSCNEQLASKLKALLSEQNIYAFQNKTFKKANEVEKIIRLLNRNKREDELWGWWKSSTESSLWMSLHVLEALTKAREMGYRVILNENKITDNLIWEISRTNLIQNKLSAIRILKTLNTKVNLPALISDVEKYGKLNMNQLFQLIELKQICGIKVSLDTLKSFRKETMFGNIYFTSDSVTSGLLTNNIQNTIIAYRIIRRDTTFNHDQTLLKIRNYFFENRSTGFWLNTYESSRIIEAILPDLLSYKEQVTKPKLVISGAIRKEIDKFPYEVTLSSDDTLKIRKSGDFPIYLTTCQRYWNPDPKEKKSDFEISTSFVDINNNMLKAGKEVKLRVQLKVKKDADYVMVNVPIPGGCSYLDKSKISYWEVYRESFRNETAIFCEKLRKGDYEFTINLLPRYTGKYTLNPAKVELMYFPTFNANNSLRKVTIE
ncbi:MAG: carboxypeptidase-like regulatory domain-containing protein [Bacteroidota bacterium]